MSTTPPEAPSGHEHPEPGDHGPRVTRDDIKDLGRIRRSRTDRKVAGVAAGIARHLDVDPLLVRVGFVLLVVFGGAGILAYGACWLLVPEEDTEDAVIRVDDNARTVILAIVGAVSLVALLGDSFGGWHFPWPLAVAGVVLAVVLAANNGKLPKPPRGPVPPPGTPSDVAADARSYGDQVAAQAEEAARREHAERHGWTYDPYHPSAPPVVDRRKRGPLLFWFTMALATLLVGVVGTVDLAGMDVPTAAYPATVLATCGLMLLVGAFYGRGGGLIFVGLVAALSTAVTTAVDDFSIGQVTHTPQTAAQLERSYELGVGQLRIDLRELDPASLDDNHELELDLDLGQIEVIVPSDGITVEATAEVAHEGHIVLFDDEETNSSGRLTADHDGGAAAPTLTIDARAGLGEILVRTEGSAR